MEQPDEKKEDLAISTAKDDSPLDPSAHLNEKAVAYTSFAPNDEETKNAEESAHQSHKSKSKRIKDQPYQPPINRNHPSNAARIKRKRRGPPKLPKTMKAIVCVRNGPPNEVLQLKDVPIPPIAKPHHVLVKVLCASINFVDYKIISGMMGSVSPKKTPFIAGTDFSGRLIAKGRAANLKHIKIGDLVYGQCWRGHQGAFAEYLVCRGKNVHKMPRSMSPLHAASMPLVSQTSYQAIQRLKLKKSDKVLILGGSTATGLIAIQIAKHFIKCSEVIVTSTQERLCKGLGADRVINYKNEEWSKVLGNYNVDAIYDCVGGQDSWDLCRTQHVLKMDGRYATIVGDQMHGEELTVGSILGTGLSLMNRKFWGAVGHQKYDFVMADSSRNLRDITALIDGGKIKAVLDAESPFKFEEFQKVFEKCKNHSARGKLVLHIADDEETEEEEEEDDLETQQHGVEQEDQGVDPMVNGDDHHNAIDDDEDHDDIKEEEYQGPRTMNDTENMNGNGPSRSNTFMLYDDGSKDVSAPEDDDYAPYGQYEEDDGDGDDEKEDEVIVEEEADDAIIDVDEVDEEEEEVQEEEQQVITVPSEKVVVEEEEEDDDEEEDSDNIFGDTADIADKQDMAHENVINAVH